MKATGTLNAVAEYVEIDIRPEDNSVLAQITGTWVGTLVPMIQAETDGPWVECRWLNTDADAPSENTDANGNFQFLRVAGAQKARVYMSAYTSGDAVVALRGSRGMGVLEPPPAVSGAATEATLQAIENNTDGLEADTAAIAAAVADVDANTDQVETKLDTLITQTADLDANTDGLESSLATVATNTTTPSSVGHGTKATSGSGNGNAAAIATSTACKYVILQARSSNSSEIRVGASGVHNGTINGGIGLAAGKMVTFVVDNLADVYLDGPASQNLDFVYGIA